MADGYLEKHHEDYEARKAAWLRKKKHLPKTCIAELHGGLGILTRSLNLHNLANAKALMLDGATLMQITSS